MTTSHQQTDLPAPTQQQQHQHASVTAAARQPQYRRGPAPAEGPSGLNAGKVRLCRYFGTAAGCRAGENCPFLHDPARFLGNVQASGMEEHVVPTTSAPAGQGRRRQAVTMPVSSRLVSRPIPKTQTEDPREFQLRQIRRRFSPKETRLSSNNTGEDEAVLSFSMAPSDPEFPFDMDKLQCSLIVPAAYPGPDAASRPRLKITNKNMPRGFAINVERGFDGLVEEKNDATLLALMSALDKNLEKFLSEKKAETVKLVVNADTRHLAALPARSVGAPLEPAVAKENLVSPQLTVSSKPVEGFTAAQKAEAQSRREMETRQLEARLGRLPLYRKSGDGIAYTIPIEPRKRSELEPPLRIVKAVQLFVPLLYPLQCCRIQLEDVKPEAAKNTEGAFEEHARQTKDMSLIGHINYLVQNFHVLAKTLPHPEPNGVNKPLVQKEEATSATPGAPQAAAVTQENDGDRSHIKFIPRPPEWTVVDSSDLSDSDDDYSYDSGDESEGGGIKIEPPDPESAQVPDKTPERGTALSFPFIELHGIELLELTTLNLTIKCSRCKATTDIINLKTGTPRTSSCAKCAALLTVTFRHDLIHAHAVRAGFLDLEACTITDMLPSTFIPTCSNCSTAYPSPPGFTCVRGSHTSNTCRSCHQKLSIHIPSIRFLRITAASATPATAPRRKRELLGLVTGTELPDRGRCRHYAKSYRWFRFSCCDRVYACDKCHDEKEEHPNEHANRMLCGWCSREQGYRPEECAFCGRGVVGRKGRGFWEGGKGTRDRVRMSRKDPRKFKRAGGGGGEGKTKAKAKEKA